MQCGCVPPRAAACVFGWRCSTILLGLYCTLWNHRSTQAGDRQPSVWLVRAHWCTVSFVRLACALTTRLAPFQARVHAAASGQRNEIWSTFVECRMYTELEFYCSCSIENSGLQTLTKEADGRPWTPPYPSRRAPRSRKSMPGCATISKPCTRPWENHREQQQQSQELLKHRRPLPTATQAWCRRCQQSRCQQQAPRCHRSLRTTL